MAGGMGHTGGLTNPRPWRGRFRAGYSNTGGPPLPRKRAPVQKIHKHRSIFDCLCTTKRENMKTLSTIKMGKRNISSL